MLKIKKEVLSDISDIFSSSICEKGFLLGCSSQINKIDICTELPALQSGKYFYEPDGAFADKIIHEWSKRGICFCGLVHSHVVAKKGMSDADIEYAQKLFTAYSLPVLWFGIGLVENRKVEFDFYSVTKKNEKKTILPVDVQVI